MFVCVAFYTKWCFHLLLSALHFRICFVVAKLFQVLQSKLHAFRSHLTRFYHQCYNYFSTYWHICTNIILLMLFWVIFVVSIYSVYFWWLYFLHFSLSLSISSPPSSSLRHLNLLFFSSTQFVNSLPLRRKWTQF